ncbi:MAG: hypothetical protein R6V50_07855, partial [Thermoplasmatota archaeon]
MKKIIVIIIFSTFLVSSYTVAAKPENIPEHSAGRDIDAPGQWRKTSEYSNQSDFVHSVLTRNLNRIRERNGFAPPGLEKVIAILNLILGLEDIENQNGDEIEEGDETYPEDEESEDEAEDFEDEDSEQPEPEDDESDETYPDDEPEEQIE